MVPALRNGVVLYLQCVQQDSCNVFAAIAFRRFKRKWAGAQGRGRAVQKAERSAMSVSIDREVMFPVHVGGRFIGTFRRTEMVELRAAIDDALLTDHQTMQAESIILTVCDWFGLSRTELMSTRRPERLVWPRQIAMQLIKLRCEMSLNEVGTLFGGKNHGTVLHACRRVEERKLIAYYARTIAAVEASLDAQCAKSSAAQRNVDSSLASTGASVANVAGTGAVGV